MRQLKFKLAPILFFISTLILVFLFSFSYLNPVKAESSIQIGQFMFTANTGSIVSSDRTNVDTILKLGENGILSLSNPQSGTVADITVTEAEGLNENSVQNLDLSNYSGRITLDNIELIGDGRQPAVQLTNAPINGCTLVITNGTKITGGTGYAIRGANTATPTGQWGSTIELHNVEEGDITSASISDLSGYISNQGFNSSNLGAVINPGNQGSVTIESYGDNTIKNSSNSGYQNWPIISPYINTGRITLNFKGDGSLTLNGVSCNGCIHLGPQYPGDNGIAKVNIYSGTLIAQHSVGGGAGIIVDGHNPESSLNVYGGTFKALGETDCDPSCGIYVNEYGSANFYGGITIAKGENCTGGSRWGSNGIHAGKITIQNGNEGDGPTVIAIGGSVQGNPVPAFGVTTGISGKPTTTTRKPVNPVIQTSDGDSFYPWLAQSYEVNADKTLIPDNPIDETTTGNVIEGFAGYSNEVDLTTQRWVKISPKKLNEITIENDPFVSSMIPDEIGSDGEPTTEALEGQYKTFKAKVKPSFEGIAIDQFINKATLPIEVTENISKVTDDSYYIKPSSKGNKLELTVVNESFFTKNYPHLKINKGSINVGYIAFIETDTSYGTFKPEITMKSNGDNNVIGRFVTAVDGSGTLTTNSNMGESSPKISSFKDLISVTDESVPLKDIIDKDTNQSINLNSVSLDHNSNLKAVYLNDLRLKTDKTELEVGETETIKLETTPTISSKHKVNWSSSNSGIVEVNNSGVIKAKSIGTANITVKTGGKETSCTINVKTKSSGDNKPVIPDTPSTSPTRPNINPVPLPPTNSFQNADVKVTGIKIEKTTASIEVDGKIQLKVTISPENATNKRVTWTSSDPKIATVDSNGLVTAKSKGIVRITVKTEDGSKAATCIVTVKDKSNQSDETTKPDNQNKPENVDKPNDQDPSEIQLVTVYRLYNELNNEHLFTTDLNEVEVLSNSGWKNEGDSWNAPNAGDPVFRLYNAVVNEHLYTKDKNEVSVLKTSGWMVDNNEQPLFYSGGNKPIYRLYHEGIRKHHLTSDEYEYKTLQSQGWNGEGIVLFSL